MPVLQQSLPYRRLNRNMSPGLQFNFEFVEIINASIENNYPVAVLDWHGLAGFRRNIRIASAVSHATLS